MTAAASIASSSFPLQRADHLHSLWLIAVVSRLSLLALCLLTSSLFPAYDGSTPLFFTSSCTSAADRLVIGSLSPFLRWDALHLLTVARDGYELEKQHAFFPLFPHLVSALSRLPSAVLPLCPSTSLLLTATLLNQLLFFLCIPLLYSLVLRLSCPPRIAFLSTLFFVLSPASVFLLAPYSETLYATLTFAGGLLFASSYLLPSCILFALCAATRSNGALHAVFPLCDGANVALSWWQQRRRGGGKPALDLAPSPDCCRAQWAWQSLSCRRCGMACRPLLPTATLSSQCSRCLPTASSLLPSAMYAEVQQRYWGVGLFCYYSAAQLPNFMLAAPVLLLSVITVSSSLLSPASAVYLPARPSLCPHILLHSLLLLLSLTVLHVQVATRFMSGLPSLYIGMAELWDREERQAGGKRWTVRRCLLLWCIGYMLIGSALFSLFLPWT